MDVQGPAAFRPRTVGEILQAAFQLYARHWQNLIALVAFVVIPLSLLQSLISQQLILNGFTSEQLANGQVEVTTPLFASLAASAVVAILSTIIWTVVLGAVTLAAAGTYLGRDLDIAASYRFGFSRFWSIVWVAILMGLAIVAGFILFVIPGFFILTRLAVSVPALIVEDRRGTGALSRSWNLVRGHGWNVFGAIFVALLISTLVSGILTSPFSGWLSAGIASAIASVITTPFTALVGIVVYLDLRVRKEGLDAATLERDLASASGPQP
ncbi:MAG TPA: hypothetical protein VE976_07905 [Actinomycetota bacterium]|nr:hypothetical protein [Actinomycetota bacterium]